ncbi:MAG: hypothetical protein GY754_14100 [bacterium]|nr:hypothetical protein [bacterium]
MKTKMFILCLVFVLAIPAAYALDIGDLFSELWPKGNKDSGGLDYSAPVGSADSGSFNVTSFNVDGFPKTIGGNSNSEFKQIAIILEDLGLDLVVFQELFTKTKHSKLKDKTTTGTYPYRSKHFRGTRTSFGDGLLRYSTFPFDKSSSGFDRVQWKKCAGDLDDYLIDGENPDCLTEKGFTMSRTDIDADLSIDVYNLHGDAGRDNDSLDVKAVNMSQFADYINTNSAGNVVVVAGDFNLGWGDGKPEEHREIIDQFIADTGVTFACEVVTGSIDNCSNEFNKPDHIVYKDNDEYSLSVASLFYRSEFVDDDGDDLSDHWAMTAEFVWEKK